MTTCKPIVDVRDLRIQIQLDEGTLTPVRGVDFRIYPGRTLGLVGESGCGKSLTCKELLRINDPKCHSTGRILFDDGEREQDILALPDNGPEIRSIRGRKISMIFQEPMSAFSPLFTIGDQVAEAVLLHITKSKKAARQIAKMNEPVSGTLVLHLSNHKIHAILYARISLRDSRIPEALHATR